MDHVALIPRDFLVHKGEHSDMCLKVDDLARFAIAEPVVPVGEVEVVPLNHVAHSIASFRIFDPVLTIVFLHQGQSAYGLGSHDLMGHFHGLVIDGGASFDQSFVVLFLFDILQFLEVDVGQHLLVDLSLEH